MIQYFHPSTGLGKLYQNNGYSHAVVLPPNAQLVITSGQPGVSPTTSKMPSEPREQIEACFDSCDVALKAAGVEQGLGAVHKVHCFFTDVNDEPVAMEVWKARFPDHRPTWMSVGVKALCGPPQMMVEIQVEAHLVVVEGAGSRL
jgi:enamine deaminase RidA (YjgF/YER057c/UK114 family)